MLFRSDLGSSRPGLEDLGPHRGGEGHVEGVEGLRRARDPQPYEGVLSMGSIGKGGRVDSSEGSEVRPRIDPHIDRVGGSCELGMGRGRGTPEFSALGVTSRYNPRECEGSEGESRDRVHNHICLDSGATEDVIGTILCPDASNVVTLDKPIDCDTVGGSVDIEARGDIEVEGLEVEGGFIAPWSSMTLLSLVKRLREG